MGPDEATKMKKIQAILVRHGADSQKVDVDVHQTSVYITGALHLADVERRTKDPAEQITEIKRHCMVMEQEIRRLGDVHDIQWKLSNWDKRGTRWVPKKVGGGGGH